MTAALFLGWIFGALGAMQVSSIKEDPSLMPGGGRPVVVLLSLFWPVVAAVAIVGLIVYGVSEL